MYTWEYRNSSVVQSGNQWQTHMSLIFAGTLLQVCMCCFCRYNSLWCINMIARVRIWISWNVWNVKFFARHPISNTNNKYISKEQKYVLPLVEFSNNFQFGVVTQKTVAGKKEKWTYKYWSIFQNFCQLEWHLSCLHANLSKTRNYSCIK